MISKISTIIDREVSLFEKDLNDDDTVWIPDEFNLEDSNNYHISSHINATIRDICLEYKKNTLTNKGELQINEKEK